MKHDAIYKLYPQVKVICGDDAFDNDGNLVEFNEALVLLEVERSEYKQKRIAEYPNFVNYLDGIVKGDDAQVQAYIDACLAVKAKYPKPI